MLILAYLEAMFYIIRTRRRRDITLNQSELNRASPIDTFCPLDFTGDSRILTLYRSLIHYEQQMSENVC
jgi:hypothetical protein